MVWPGLVRAGGDLGAGQGRLVAAWYCSITLEGMRPRADRDALVGPTHNWAGLALAAVGRSTTICNQRSADGRRS